jgi:hypothetical protein
LGAAFAALTRSLTSFHGELAATTMKKFVKYSGATGSKSLTGSYGSVLKTCGCKAMCVLSTCSTV